MCEDLDELDQSASNTGSGQRVGSSVQSCPTWTVTVTVRSTVESWPQDNVRVWLKIRSGTLQHGDKHTRMESRVSAPVVFEGTGAQEYMARASTGSHAWKFVEKPVEVDGTQKVAVELSMEPAHFVAFRLLDDATGEPVTGPKFQLTLPGNKDQDLEITNGETGEHGIELTQTGETKVRGIEVSSDDIYEVVSIA